MGERKSRGGEKRHITSNNMKMSLREGPKKGLFYLAASAKKSPGFISGKKSP